MRFEMKSARPGPIVVRSIIVAASLLVGTVYLAAASRVEDVPIRQSLASLPMDWDGWRGRRDADFTDDVLAVLGVDDYIVRSYFKPGATGVGLYIGYHSSQRQGDTIHSPLNCLPGAGWQPTELSRVTLHVKPTAAATATVPIEVNRVIIAKGVDRQLVYYWYQSHQRVVASEYWGKIYTVLDSVRYNRTDAAMVRVVLPIPDRTDLKAVDATAIEFVQSLFPQLESYLPS